MNANLINPNMLARTEEEQSRLAAILQTVDEMNREMLKDNKLGLFLYKLNAAVLRTGMPVPRYVCEEAGVDKRTLKLLVRKGFLNEHRVRRHNEKNPCYTEVVGFTMAADIGLVPSGDRVIAIPKQEERAVVGTDV